MKKLTSISLILLSLVLVQTTNAAEVILNPVFQKITPTVISTSDPIFTRSLTIGSYGQDVMALKKIISLELGTILDKTATFTTNTANDVKKLQEKYAVEVLIPNGLSSGTGYVGFSTMTKLNTLAFNYNIRISDFTLPPISMIKNIFMTTLALGSSGNDVSLLKIVLNSDKDTKIATSSTGEISNVFDLATQTAVNKFQEKYAREVLAPSGLTRGTGTVGPATRKKLNYILTNILTSIQSGKSSTTTSTSSNQ